MLPLSKRPPQLSASDLVHTDEIEVVSERAPRSTRRPLDRRNISYPSLPAPVPAPRSWAESRQRTIVPPPVSVRPLPPLHQSDDEMTVLMGHRPLPASYAAMSRRITPAPWSVRATIPTPTPFPYSLDREARLAITGPAHRPSDNPPAPDSLRPVEMFAAGGAALSGRHDAPPMAITMHAPAQDGRPTFTWAASLVVIGALVGLGSALFAHAGAGPTASSPSSVSVSPMAAAAAQPPAEAHAQEAVPAAPPTKTAPVVPATSEWVPVPPAPTPATDSRADGTSRSASPLAALVDAKGHGEASQRPTYVAPGAATPGRRWVAASKAVAPGPTSASMDAIVAKLGGGSGATSPEVTAAPPPSPPPPAPKPVAKGKAKRAADADLQAASASDALARAQLEAALR